MITASCMSACCQFQHWAITVVAGWESTHPPSQASQADTHTHNFYKFPISRRKLAANSRQTAFLISPSNFSEINNPRMSISVLWKQKAVQNPAAASSFLCSSGAHSLVFLPLPFAAGQASPGPVLTGDPQKSTGNQRPRRLQRRSASLSSRDWTLFLLAADGLRCLSCQALTHSSTSGELSRLAPC
jgi:hypothetical protein